MRKASSLQRYKCGYVMLQLASHPTAEPTVQEPRFKGIFASIDFPLSNLAQ